MDCRSWTRYLLPLSLIFAVNTGAKPSQAQTQAPPAAEKPEKAPPAAADGQKLFGTISLSTYSEDARKYLELSIDKYENGLLDDAVVHAQHATEQDQNFALAYAFLTFARRRGTPDASAQARAKALLPSATPDEQLLGKWLTGVQEADILPAIISMNELLERFPKNKHILFLTSEWLYFQQDYDRAGVLMEKALQVDTNFAPALNRLGHSYIEADKPDPAKAIASLKRYLELDPAEPTPEISLAEALRATGDDKGSLDHYAAALQLDPTSYPSRIGLADTLTLMGDYSGAREQYDKAIATAQTPRDRFHAEYQKRLISFWEGHADQGRKMLLALAEQARSEKAPYAQVEIGFARVLLAANYDDELPQLQSLESLLHSPVDGMSEADRNFALAAVWREEARVRALSGLAKPAAEAVQALGQLATNTRDPMIENLYESGRGYELLAGGKFAAAADELAADPRNPLVVRQLIQAQEKLGQTSDAESTRARMKYLRAPTPEWYLVSHPTAVATAKKRAGSGQKDKDQLEPVVAQPDAKTNPTVKKNGQ